MRKTRTSRRVSTWRRSSRKVSCPWTKEEISFMRKYYRRFETAWVARQLGRTVYSIRYKAVDLCIRKASPSVWKGNRGPVNAFKKPRTVGKTTRTATRRKTTKRRTTHGWRATTARHSVRRTKTRRTIRRRSR
ncbi:MAG: hypothetical protein ACE5D6_01960 [Candidatus Zixiibacteriota bacterium]